MGLVGRSKSLREHKKAPSRVPFVLKMAIIDLKTAIFRVFLNLKRSDQNFILFLSSAFLF